MPLGWTTLLCFLCITWLAAAELKQIDRFRYLASFPLKDDIGLHCNADLLIKYVPTAVARWMKDKEEVIGSDRLSIDETYTLHIKQLQPADSGMYACVVAFPGGTEVISNEIKLSAGGRNLEFGSWLKNKGSVGGMRNVWAASAVSCVIITLLWVIIILIMCKRRGKRKAADGEEEEEDQEMGFSYDEDESASETEALVKKKKGKKDDKKKPKKGSKKGKRK